MIALKRLNAKYFMLVEDNEINLGSDMDFFFQVLQVDVVKLVNDVASIVHESVVKNLGAPNKNIGDAFLVIWKCDAFYFYER